MPAIENLHISVKHLGSIPTGGFEELFQLDRAFVGTKNYMGLAYFWEGSQVRHIMRALSAAKRRRVHAELLANHAPQRDEISGKSYWNDDVIEPILHRLGLWS